jgi:hypothetical protein
MARGFALTIDSTLAVIVLAIFLAVYAFLSYQAMEDPHVPLLLEKEADDLLIVLDKSGVLGSGNASLINQTVNRTLPEYLSWNMEVEYYNYTAGFGLEANETLGEECSGAGRKAVAQREFVVFENRSVRYYGIARLRLWVE